MDLDRKDRTVTVEAGMSYGDLATFLDHEGFALHNMASLPHISVGGAIATATHGSGDRNSNLSAAVSALKIVTADGALKRYSRECDDSIFPGLVVSLGLLGVVTEVTLDIEPTFEVSQSVYEAIPLEAILADFDEVMACAYSVSLFTTWADNLIDQVWTKSRVGDRRPLPRLLANASVATCALHPIRSVSADSCTQQLGVKGLWHQRLPHFRPGFTPSKGEELQSEYFVARADAVAALKAVSTLATAITPHLQISEIRSVAADDLWLSPCYRKDCIGIHFTWKPDLPSVSNVLTLLEAALQPFQAKPHWSKLSIAQPINFGAYPHYHNFARLKAEFDPSQKFGGWDGAMWVNV